MDATMDAIDNVNNSNNSGKAFCMRVKVSVTCRLTEFSGRQLIEFASCGKLKMLSFQPAIWFGLLKAIAKLCQTL